MSDYENRAPKGRHTNTQRETPNAAPATTRNAWLQILRPPNLFTVPGDPLAGYLLVGLTLTGANPVWSQAALAAGASLCLYAAGLIHNDICDFAEDARERPARPLPSGRITKRSAWFAAVTLTLAGLALAAAASWVSLAVAILLAYVIALYNRIKRVRIVGPLLMGLCRGLSLLLGAAVLWQASFWNSDPDAVFGTMPHDVAECISFVLVMAFAILLQPPVLISVCGLTLFIAAVTAIAAGETQSRPVGIKRFLPAAIVLCWLASLCAVLLWSPWHLPGVAIAAWAVVWLAHCGHALRGVPAPAVVQRTIGKFIGGLLFIQAALVALAGPKGLVVAAVLLLAFPISRRVARWFYAS